MTSDSASRVTRSSRGLRPAVLLLAFGLAAVSVLRAQEPPPADAAPEGAESAGQDGPAATAQPRAQDAAPPAPAEEQEPPPADPDRKRGVVGPTPGRFEPTEKVRADFDVSFPVDI